VSPDALLLHELDAGEAAVIQTAATLGIGQVLLDDRKARRIAAVAYSLEVRGTCALLIAAKARGLIPDVRKLLEAMRRNGYFIGPELMAECLRRAGEL
jgi:predicted nucleic acid-binding protein